MGIKDSLFICEDGRVEHYVEEIEGESFYEYVENLSEEEFNKICDEFVQAIEEKDLAKMHKGLAVFDEMDNYDIGTSDMKRRLMRLRESTHEESYKFKDDGLRNFILYKGRTYVLK